MKTILLTVVVALGLIYTGSTVSAMVDREPPHLPNVSTIQHEVKSGDTLYFVAVRYHVSLDDLIQVNPQIDNPHWIYPNERLNIPNYGEVQHQ